MAFSYGFFNAQNLDRVYTAEDFTAYLSSLICNGILDTYRQCFAPTVKNLSVTFVTLLLVKVGMVGLVAAVPARTRIPQVRVERSQ